MSTAIALTSSGSPADQSSMSILNSGAAHDHACLEMYEPQSAKGGSATGSSLGKITFQFNPKEVTISKSAKWERQPAKGAKKSGPPEYKGADPCKMTVEMFFDAALKADLSVVDAVEKLFSCCVPLAKTVPKSPMPPMVVFKWGGVSSFPAVVTQVNAKYTRFASNGIPIRAVCTVNLEEMPSEAAKQNPTSGVLAVDRAHTMIAGDTLALVAYREYGDSKLWRPLATYNSIDDPMRIANGAQVLLPNVEVLLG
ncbi:peptidase M23 [Mycobacterium sp. AZCC_0083]|uniref:CIS tube protein n=1 Tax=Mycobacterium sp. AZCC_0083 TaxID=2735882 RepID=UPI001620648D|nr:peptidase M23 [Mycobacterium sp. AZCC_0083]MBB5166968.1 nucleoid-associated protein YgaU [Mycobacterium sp. AZCC_0083]